MKNLNYETVATDRHTVTVATWDTFEPGGVGYKITVDGKVLDVGVIEASPWDGPMTADECPAWHVGVIGDDASPSEE